MSECAQEVFSNKYGTTKAIVCSCGFATSYTVLINDADARGMEHFHVMHEAYRSKCAKNDKELVRCEACPGHPKGFWENDAAFWAAEEAAKRIAATPGMMNRFIFHDIKAPILEEMRKLTAIRTKENEQLREACIGLLWTMKHDLGWEFSQPYARLIANHMKAAWIALGWCPECGHAPDDEHGVLCKFAKEQS